jgi:hypothetical protein
MKNIITLCAAFLMTAIMFAQSPNKMSYQAVIRNNSNVLVTNSEVGMQISILQTSAEGTAVYVETQSPASNANGLVSIEIGAGTVVSGSFATIDWANGPYFIKTETDPAGGTSYSITGTSQLLSVPYALHAKTAESITGTITETDPIFDSSVASGITGTDTSNWNNKQDQLTAGDNINIFGNTISATDGNKTLSFSKETNVSQSYIMMDTIAIKAGKVVTIKGYVQTTGSECSVQLYDLNSGQWVNELYAVWTIYEEEGIGFASFIGTNGAIVPYSTSKKEFTTYFLPTSDFMLQIRAKELTATSGNGIGEATVIVIQ